MQKKKNTFLKTQFRNLKIGRDETVCSTSRPGTSTESYPLYFVPRISRKSYCVDLIFFLSGGFARSDFSMTAVVGINNNNNNIIFVLLVVVVRNSILLVLSMRLLSSSSSRGSTTSSIITFSVAQRQYRLSLKSQRQSMDAPMNENGDSSIAASGIGFQDIAGGSSSKSISQCVVPPLTPWREAIEVSIAKSRKIRGGNYVQLSTIDSETNEPRCRTLVFRGFQPLAPQQHEVDCNTTKKSYVMKMITDCRSNKVKELTSSSISEIVWWFSQSSEQYRIRGRIQLVGQDALDDFLKQARKEQWGNLSDSAREQFYWTTPGIQYQEQPNEIPVGGRNATNGRVLPPPKEFLLMLLHPFRVDYLRLSDNYRQIDEYDVRSDSWHVQRVTP